MWVQGTGLKSLYLQGEHSTNGPISTATTARRSPCQFNKALPSTAILPSPSVPCPSQPKINNPVRVPSALDGSRVCSQWKHTSLKPAGWRKLPEGHSSTPSKAFPLTEHTLSTRFGALLHCWICFSSVTLTYLMLTIQHLAIFRHVLDTKALFPVYCFIVELGNAAHLQPVPAASNK